MPGIYISRPDDIAVLSYSPLREIESFSIKNTLAQERSNLNLICCLAWCLCTTAGKRCEVHSPFTQFFKIKGLFSIFREYVTLFGKSLRGVKGLKRKSINKFMALLVALVFLFGSVIPVAAQSPSASNEIHYVALGDSLAAGQTPFKEIETSYTDMIAAYFEEQQLLASYTNQFAVPGYTSQNVLDDVLTNHEVDGKKIQDAIRDATLITLTVGANDLLREADIDLEAGTVSLEQEKALLTLTKQKENLTRLFQKIKELNPDAAVYVSGYYQAFPYLDPAQLAPLDGIFQALNGTIQLAAVENGVSFVPLAGIFDNDLPTYLPNPADIHPSLEGYEKMAAAFIASFQMEPETDISFVDLPKTYWAYPEISLLVNNNVLSGISDTHFGPAFPITRAETAEALLRIVPFDQSVPENPGFSDVDESDDAYYAIAKLTEAGVFNKAETFNPDAPLTRAQMAKVLTIAFQLEADSTSSFSDVRSSHWSKSYVDALVSAHITTGFPDNTFRPGVATTRTHFAVFLVRTYQQANAQ